jgi:hypothetical protein
VGRLVADLIFQERLRAAHVAGRERFLADRTGAADTLVEALTRTLEDFQTGERTDDTAAVVLSRSSGARDGDAGAETDREPAHAIPTPERG